MRDKTKHTFDVLGITIYLSRKEVMFKKVVAM